MTEMGAAATFDAKPAFESFSASHGITIKHYHCHNGLYDTKNFKASINKASQTISFCGVNTHHQNGKVENRINDLNTNARTVITKPAHRCPDTIDNALWPAALKNYCNLRNNLSTTFIVCGKYDRKKLPDGYIKIPIQCPHVHTLQQTYFIFHPFGSHACVLKNNLQAHQ